MMEKVQIYFIFLKNSFQILRTCERQFSKPYALIFYSYFLYFLFLKIREKNSKKENYDDIMKLHQEILCAF